MCSGGALAVLPDFGGLEHEKARISAGLEQVEHDAGLLPSGIAKSDCSGG
jgi:hypothetical protein